MKKQGILISIDKYKNNKFAIIDTSDSIMACLINSHQENNSNLINKYNNDNFINGSLTFKESNLLNEPDVDIFKHDFISGNETIVGLQLDKKDKNKVKNYIKEMINIINK